MKKLFFSLLVVGIVLANVSLYAVPSKEVTVSRVVKASGNRSLGNWSGLHDTEKTCKVTFLTASYGATVEEDDWEVVNPGAIVTTTASGQNLTDWLANNLKSSAGYVLLLDGKRLSALLGDPAPGQQKTLSFSATVKCDGGAQNTVNLSVKGNQILEWDSVSGVVRESR